MLGVKQGLSSNGGERQRTWSPKLPSVPDSASGVRERGTKAESPNLHV